MDLPGVLFLKGRAQGAVGRVPQAKDPLKEAGPAVRVLGARQQQAACGREVGELHLTGGTDRAALVASRAWLEPSMPPLPRPINQSALAARSRWGALGEGSSTELNLIP
jgi:hypothetical protein